MRLHVMFMKPFYFRSYGKVVGIAHDLKELEKEIERIGSKDPACVNYHLKEGHVTSWLAYIGEKEAAEALEGVNDFKEALSRLRALPQKGEKMGGPMQGMMQRRKEMMERRKEMMQRMMSEMGGGQGHGGVS